MKYCKRCLYPDTKPGLTFNEEGLCSACISYDERTTIDWSQREDDFRELAFNYDRDDLPHNCIVPVSGGKDSTFQVIKALEMGFRPLAVCATTDDISDLGRSNLDNISNHVDLIEIHVNKSVRKRLAKYALLNVGDISWAEHVTIFTLPFREAIKREIPLIFWGENPQNEYGGPNENANRARELTTRWLGEFGGMNGLRVKDMVDKRLMTRYDAEFYTVPKIPKGYDLQSYFMGHYFEWDGYANALLAEKHGFQISIDPVEGCGFHYENLDNYQTGIHDYFKYLKFGFGRATDLVCNHIRRGYCTRSEGIQYVKDWDGQYPATYLGRSINRILGDIDVTMSEFFECCERFTNRELFDIDGKPPYNIVPKFELPNE